MSGLRRWTRATVLAGLCAGLFACLGGVGALTAPASPVSPEVQTPTAPEAQSTAMALAEVDRSTPAGDDCECCTDSCSVVIDRARTSVDHGDLLALWTMLGLGTVIGLLYAAPRRQRRWAPYERRRWWCQPTTASLCVILR